jgi:alpha-glucosidase
MRADATVRSVDCAHPDVLHLVRSDGWETVTNFGSSWVPLPVGEVVFLSEPIAHGILPPNTTAWLRPA